VLMIHAVVSSIRSRLAALRKKLAILAKRAPTPSANVPGKMAPSNPVSVGATPPK
jgi:serine/threonine-protein kinase ULK/ATG1